MDKCEWKPKPTLKGNVAVRRKVLTKFKTKVNELLPQSLQDRGLCMFSWKQSWQQELTCFVDVPRH